MSKAIILDNSMKQTSEVALPASFSEISEQNLYLYVKSYMAGVRANTAMAKTRAAVSGGGKKPWMQKGGGRARAGSITSPVFVGGGKAHGPVNYRNYTQKINKKQKKLALQCALQQKANQGKLFLMDKLAIESGKTKDAAALAKSIQGKSVLFVTGKMDEKTFLAFRNLPNCYLAEPNEINAYMVAVFNAVVMEQEIFETITKED